MKNIIIWIIILISFFGITYIYSQMSEKVREIDYTEFYSQMEKGNIKDVEIIEKNIKGHFKDSSAFKTLIPYEDSDLIKDMVRAHVQITVKSPNNFWTNILPYLFPILIFVFFWFIFVRQMSSGQNKAFTFGRSKARMIIEQKVTFKDIAGVEEAKEELSEIVDFLKHPGKFTRLGGKIPKGVLLVGAPGTGKTLLAKAVSGEANVPFFTISGSDFVEMFVGVGASRVRDLFKTAKRNSPSIVFIDEIDAVGRHRGAGIGGGHDEREQTLNALLVEMDGFDTRDEVIIVAATNRPDILDPALLRPGRFDRQVIVDRPDIRGREKIFKIHTKKVLVADDIEYSILAKATPGFVGADIANMVNEAALIAARKDKIRVEMDDFEDAKDKVIMGLERKSAVISDEEKKLSAYHESGHVICAKHLKYADEVHKVTVIPRGRALGVTQFLPKDDKHTYSKNYLMDQIVALLGGRAAEKIVFESVSTGAGNDIQRATEIAHKMVCEWGMSEKVGPIQYSNPNDNIFLGREITQHKDFSEETAQLIDSEIKNIIDNAMNKALSILNKNIDIMNTMAKYLLKRETLSKEEIDKIINNEVLTEIKKEEKKEEEIENKEEGNETKED